MSVVKEFIENLNYIKENIKDNNELLLLYGMFKQATCGNNIIDPDFRTLKEKKLWESWEKYKDTPKKRCMIILNDYINYIKLNKHT